MGVVKVMPAETVRRNAMVFGRRARDVPTVAKSATMLRNPIYTLYNNSQKPSQDLKGISRTMKNFSGFWRRFPRLMHYNC
jgi:hypothetical protein